MLFVKTRRFLLWNDLTVFFPSVKYLEGFATRLRFDEIVRLSETAVDLSGYPNLFRRKLALTTWLDLSRNLDTLYGAMDSKSCRYEIRRAGKMSDRISIMRNGGALDAFFDLYNKFVSQKGYADPLSRRRFKEFVKIADVFVASVDSRPVCGHLMVRDQEEGRVRLGFSASLRLESKETANVTGAVNRFLHWHEIQTYKSEGIRMYDFAGIEDGTTPIARFKLSFGGEQLVEHCYVFMGRGGQLAYRAYQKIPLLLNRSRRRSRIG